jgi:hypothetical protein
MLGDIYLPPYISDDKYLRIVKHLEKYFTNKKFTVLEGTEGYIHVYYDGDEYVNMMINNLIVHTMIS